MRPTCTPAEVREHGLDRFPEPRAVNAAVDVLCDDSHDLYAAERGYHRTAAHLTSMNDRELRNYANDV